MTSSRLRRTLWIAGATLCMALTACSSSPPLDSAAASSLQQGVRQVAVLAAAHDYSTALRQLHDLQSELTGATRAGRVTAARAVRIQSAIDQIQADLSALQVGSAPRSSATPSPARTSPSAARGKSKNTSRKSAGGSGSGGNNGDSGGDQGGGGGGGD
ncbi:MAG: hypothetical protein M3N46_06710 [Actinomycetota bacterium]|nr:hypothetical protein [Actinomycetota bacterium]